MHILTKVSPFESHKQSLLFMFENCVYFFLQPFSVLLVKCISCSFPNIWDDEEISFLRVFSSSYIKLHHKKEAQKRPSKNQEKKRKIKLFCERLRSDHLFRLSFQIQFDCISQFQNSQYNVSVVSGNSNMIILHLLRPELH